MEFKKRVPEQTGSVTSTLDVNHDIPSTKLILVSGPIYPDNRSAAPTSNSQVSSQYFFSSFYQKYN